MSDTNGLISMLNFCLDLGLPGRLSPRSVLASYKHLCPWHRYQWLLPGVLLRLLSGTLG